jgi:cob(I)alamin adenosyltransferase
MTSMGKGYVHIYTGSGKGKSTAALGLALRAAGSGMKTRLVQFMKGRHYGELDAVKMTGGLITIEQFGHPSFCSFGKDPDPADVERARSALSRLKELMHNRACDILVADELITASLFGLVTEEDVLGVMKDKPPGMELVLTGRGATQRMIEAADLVTEMHEVKHYYSAGVQARKGIES